MEEVNFKNLNTIIDEVESDKKNKELIAEKEKYNKVNNILDSVIKYCYNQGQELFVLEDTINKMRDKELLSNSNNVSFEINFLTDTLDKKNIIYTIFKGKLIVNISGKNYSRNEYEKFYFTNELIKKQAKITEYSKGIILSIILTMLLNLSILKNSIIMKIDIVDIIRNIYLYICVIGGVLNFLLLIYTIKEKYTLKKKLNISEIITDN